MTTPRSALKFDLFADASRKRKLDTNGDPLQVMAEHIDFAQLAALVEAFGNLSKPSGSTHGPSIASELT